MEYFSQTLDYFPYLLKGLGWTAAISLVAMVAGMTLGLLGAFARDSRNRLVRLLATAYVDLFRTTPLFIQLLWIYYALPILVGGSLTGLQAGTIGMSLYAGAYATEVIRAGLHSVDRGQYEAAAAIGMSGRQAFLVVIAPQALRNVLPALGNVLITIVKDTSLLSVVAVPDLLRNAQVVGSVMQRDLEPLTVAAVMYLFLTVPLSVAVAMVRRRGTRSGTPRLRPEAAS